MQIKSLHLSAFRAHVHTSIDLAPVTLITGPNGSGKSTFMAALEYILSSRCSLTNERGLGGELVTIGADLANLGVVTNGGRSNLGAVAAELVGGDSFTRTTDGKLSLSWEPRCKPSDAQHKLESAIGCSGDAARLAVRASRFFGMDDKARKTLLSEVLQLTVDASAVLAALEAREKVSGLPLVDVGKSVIGPVKNWAGLERAHKLCYDERTHVKRDAKELSAQVEAYKSDDEVFTPESELTTLSTRHKSLDTEYRALCQEYGELSAIARQLDGAQAMLERAAAGYKDAFASAMELAAITGNESAWQGVKSEPEDNSTTIAALETEMRVVYDGFTQLGTLTREYSTAKADVDRLEGDSAKAGLCPWSEGTACVGASLRQAAIQDQLQAATERLETLDDRLRATKESLRGCRSNAAIQTDLTDARTARDAALTQSHLRESAILRLQHATRAFEVERSRVESLTAQADMARLAQIEAYKPGLAATLESLSAELDILRGQAALKAQRDSTRDRLRAAEQKAKALEELVAFFSPNGYQAELLAAQIAPLSDTVGRILSNWGMQARYSPDLTLEVDSGVGWLPYACLADSTQILVGLAHQVAFATLPGSCTGLVVVDRIESLDDASQQTLFAACEQLASSVPGLHHIILLGVRCVSPPASVSCVDLSMKRAVAA